MEGSLAEKGMTYSEAISSSLKDKRSPKGERGEMQRKVRSLTGAKRPRSPGEQHCGRCFRSTHKTSEYRH